jgi:glycosyltransferase involved in cell wall biosynthesis
MSAGEFVVEGHFVIYVAMPIGSQYGWGIVGKHITLEMAKMDGVRLLADPFTPESIGDELEYHALAATLQDPQEVPAPPGQGEASVPGPLLTCVTDHNMLPYRKLRGTFTVGHAVFENNLLPSESLANARRHFDHVATASNWCTEVLKSLGASEVSTVIQGIDPGVFDPAPRPRQFLADKFVVFSGGKLELRKGQDLVIRAYKVLQDKYKDVMLVTSWANLWAFSLNTMRSSPYIRFAPTASDHAAMVNQVLHDNGIDVARTIHLGLRPNATMSKIYRNTDVGLFPNRCEGGTNLVLMEYMACGKPVIASFSTGHRDILTPQNCIPIQTMRPFKVFQGDKPLAVWDDPDLDEMICHLEYAYQHRDRLAELGRQAGCDLARFTWRRTAEQFHSLLTRNHQ